MEGTVGRSRQGLGLGRPSSPGVVPRAAQLRLRAGLQLPLVRFSNPVGMNLCYANSAVQAWYWLRELSDSAESLQGTERFFASAHSVLITECMSFRALWRGWTGITRQHDVGEFWQHLVNSLQLDAFAGQWQALLTLPYQVQDSGTLDCPIMLPLSNSTFQGLINDWHNQYAVHGLQHSGGVVCFCLRRYTENRRKNMCRIAITPGSRVNLPHFQAPTESTEVESQAYHAAFVILHLGEVITSGHYQAALSVDPLP